MYYVVNWNRRTWKDGVNVFVATQRKDNKRYAAVLTVDTIDATSAYTNREGEGIQVLDATTFTAKFVAIPDAVAVQEVS